MKSSTINFVDETQEVPSGNLALSTNGPSIFRILSIDGGGYLGLATATFIRGIEQHHKVRFSDTFDLFCGTSTGAILALGLANGRSGAELTELYQRLGKVVFAKRRLFAGFGIRARYDNRRLRAFLKEEFGDATIGHLHARGKTALVTAFNLTTGKPRIFKTDHAPNLSLHNGYLLSDIALASSAAPFYFPAVAIRNPVNSTTELFCDGGIVANHPALLGFSEAVSDLGKSPASLKILSLSTPGVDFGEGIKTLRWADRGLLRWRSKLPSMFIESGAAIADQILLRLIGALPDNMRPQYERVEMNNRDKLAMDCASTSATAALVHEGVTRSSCNLIRDRVAKIIG